MIPLLNELKLLAPNLYITATGPNATWQHQGRLTKEIFERLNLDINADYFICGPGKMVMHVTKICKSIGVPENNLHTESWTK